MLGFVDTIPPDATIAVAAKPRVKFVGQKIISTAPLEDMKVLRVSGIYVRDVPQIVCVDGSLITASRSSSLPLTAFSGIWALLRLHFGVAAGDDEGDIEVACAKLTPLQQDRLDRLLTNEHDMTEAAPDDVITFEISNPSDKPRPFSASIFGMAEASAEEIAAVIEAGRRAP